jgi:hypothetical protein
MPWIDGSPDQSLPPKPPRPLVNDDSSGWLFKCVWDVFQGERHQRENAVRQITDLRGGASFETILQVIHAFVPIR